MEKIVVETKILSLPGDHVFTLDSGKSLRGMKIAYETYGTLSAAKDNAILICHALSGDAHAAFYGSPDDKKPGWWDVMIGPGKPFDTDKYFIISSNVIGGCKGSTGPASINPETNRPYGMTFPFITIHDMVRAQSVLIDHLDIDTLFAVAGGSMGGMQAMAWAKIFPARVKLCIPIATALYQSAQNIALHEVGRKSIMSDPNFNGGDYYGHEHPKAGLSIARMVGHISYLSDDAMQKKFGRRLQNMERYAFDITDEFQVESYLDYQGESFIRRFDANSYVFITRAIDYFDMGFETSPAGVFADVTARFLVLSYSSDWLYPPYQCEEIVSACKANAIPVTYVKVETDAGHDGFLIKNDMHESVVRSFLDSAYRAEVPVRSTSADERLDFQFILDEVPEGSRILDLGSGDGTLLARLARSKRCTVQGVEIDRANFLACVDNGVAVMQRDLNDVLSDYPENAFDYVIFNLTIQMTKHAVRALDEAHRIRRRVIASYPKFGYYANLLS
ncbi:MAG: homoserine O-acetyltransferase, partial [Spirochaetota bacterium]